MGNNWRKLKDIIKDTERPTLFDYLQSKESHVEALNRGHEIKDKQ